MQNIIKKWEEIPLSQISDNLDSQRVPVSKLKRKNGNIPYYGATGIVDYVNDFIFDEELLLVGEDGADWSANANTAYLINGKSWVNNHAHVLRVTKANIGYVMIYLNYSDLREYTTGTTRGKLNKASLMSIKIPLPELNVQQKIAEILSSVDDAIEKTGQIIQKTEKLKQGLMQQALISNNSKTFTLKEILSLIIDHRGLTPKKLGGDWTTTGIPAISAMNIKNGKIVNHKKIRFISEILYKKWMPEKLQKGDILLTSEAPLGEAYIVKDNGQYCLSQRLFALRPNISIIKSKYLYYFLISDYGEEALMVRSSGTTAKGIKQAELVKIKINIPNLTEQEKIGDLLSSIDQKIDYEKKRKIKLTLIKQGLVQDIFNQKVQVN